MPAGEHSEHSNQSNAMFWLQESGQNLRKKPSVEFGEPGRLVYYERILLSACRLTSQTWCVALQNWNLDKTVSYNMVPLGPKKKWMIRKTFSRRQQKETAF